MIDVILPLTRFEVRYELASGRPYADLERLVLEAICEGINQIDSLVETFKLKPRVVIEVVITLARAGWVSLSIETGTFSVTLLGRQAAGGGVLPPFTMVAMAFDIVVLEAWTGLLSSQRDINITNTVALKNSGVWASAIRLPTRITDDRIDHGQVINLLRRNDEEWIRTIETPSIIARGRHWLRARVDSTQDIVLDLPARWEPTLTPLLLDAVAEKTNTPRKTKTIYRNRVIADLECFPAECRPDDILTSSEEHLASLRDVLVRAKSMVFIASAFFDITILEGELRQLVVAALMRGVHIHLLWGYGMSEGRVTVKNSIKFLRELRKEAGSAGENLRFSGTPTESHAKLILADPDGELIAFVGSFEWLSTGALTDQSDCNDVSIKLRAPAILSQLLQTAAALWMTNREGLLSDAPERLRHLAAECAKRALDVSNEQALTNVRVRLVRDVEHEHLLCRFLEQEGENRLVVSHQLGQVAATRLKGVQSATAAGSLTVLYGRRSDTVSETQEIELCNQVVAQSARIEKRPGLHAKLCVAGNSAIVSSYNFLSADPFQTAKNAREVGIMVVGEVIAQRLRSVFCSH